MFAGESTLPAAQRIDAALQRRGARTHLMDLANVTLGRGEVRHQGELLTRLDAAIGYHGALMPAGGIEKLAQLERMGLPVLNGVRAIELSADKWMTSKALQEAGVPHPQSMLARTSEDVIRGARLLSPGGEDWSVVLKLRTGTEGKGVAKVSNIDELSAIGDLILATGNDIVMQSLIRLPKGRIADTRAFVVDGKVIASMERSANPSTKDFRNNLSNGGTGVAVRLHRRDEDTAVRASQALHLDIAGIDLMGERGAMQVIEGNSGPGHKISEVTGIDVAEAIADATIRRATQRHAAAHSAVAR